VKYGKITFGSRSTYNGVPRISVSAYWPPYEFSMGVLELRNYYKGRGGWEVWTVGQYVDGGKRRLPERSISGPGPLRDIKALATKIIERAGTPEHILELSTVETLPAWWTEATA
jgi:hypothetical protein